MWDKAYQEAFDSLKEALAGTPVLPFPVRDLPYMLNTDASA